MFERGNIMGVYDKIKGGEGLREKDVKTIQTDSTYLWGYSCLIIRFIYAKVADKRCNAINRSN